MRDKPNKKNKTNPWEGDANTAVIAKLAEEETEQARLMASDEARDIIGAIVERLNRKRA